jgi:hypothetical protein
VSENSIDRTPRKLKSRPEGNSPRGERRLKNYLFQGRYWEHDWARVEARLGRVPDYLLAEELGAQPATVRAMRRRLGRGRAPSAHLELRWLVRELRRMDRLLQKWRASYPRGESSPKGGAPSGPDLRMV